jgi:hypothetical protein
LVRLPNGLISGSGSPSITPIIAVGANDNENLDIGTGALRFRNIYSKTFTGTDFIGGGKFGGSSEPVAINTGSTFNGTATFAKTAAKTANGISGTAVGSGDIAIRYSGADATFDGSTTATVSILASSSASNNSIVRRTSNGSIDALTYTTTQTAGSVAFVGMATSAQGVYSGGTTYTPTALASGTGLVVISSGTINATTFAGTASKANYADLAENYKADAQYEPGTVLEFGGEFEVTVAEDETRRVAGVVSSDPAYLMNSKLEGENVVAIALQGRVPCKVRGVIKKGDMMVSAGGGYARPTHDPKLGTIIGKALQDWEGGEGVIEVVVGRL